MRVIHTVYNIGFYNINIIHETKKEYSISQQTKSSVDDWWELLSPVTDWSTWPSLTLRANDLHVEVGQAAGSGQGKFDHALHGDGVAVQVVKQRAMLMVV